MSDYIPSPLRLRLSSIAGSIALACWLVLIIPQLLEMFRVRDVKGISPLFLLAWTIGDVANVVGALWAGLLPEVILTGFWFLFADLFTLLCYYYLLVLGKSRESQAAPIPNEESQLLPPEIEGTTQIPPEEESQLRAVASTQSKNSLAIRRYSSTIDDVVLEPQRHSVFVRYILPLIFVATAGIVGSLLSPNGSTSSSPDSKSFTATAIEASGPQICGYISAFMYLTARLPQIAKNYENKSCKGLSLLFFFLSTLANLCYGLQIIFYRNDWSYLKLNLSWILGSTGTIFEDCIIYVQFYLYNTRPTTRRSVAM